MKYKKFNIKRLLVLALVLLMTFLEPINTFAVESEELNNLDKVNLNYAKLDSTHQTGSFQVNLSDAEDQIKVYQVATITFTPDYEGSETGTFADPEWTEDIISWLEGEGSEFATYNTPGKLGEQSENIRTNFFKALFDKSKGNTSWENTSVYDSKVNTDVIVSSKLEPSVIDDEEEPDDSAVYYTVKDVPLGIYAVVGYTESKDYSPAIAGLIPERDSFDNWTVKTDVAITLKAADVYLHKFINEEKSDIVRIGETVSFDIEFQLPTYNIERGAEGTYTFELQDYMDDAFDMDESTFSLQSRSGSSSPWSPLDNKYYSKSIEQIESGTSIHIDFDYGKFIEDEIYNSKMELKVSYNARVNRKIETGSEANINEAILTYETNSTGTTTTIITDTVRAYTYGLRLIKQDGATTEPGKTPIYLDNTHFKLYKETLFFVGTPDEKDKINDEDYILMGAMPDSDLTDLDVYQEDVEGTTLDEFRSTYDAGGTGGTYVYHSYKVEEDTTFDNGVTVSAGKYVTRVFQIVILEDNEGTLFDGELITTGNPKGDVIKGLDVGNYYLSETLSHKGYNNLAEDILFSIYKVDDTIASSERNGSYAVFADTPYDEETNEQSITDDDGLYDLTVLNYKGLTLPSTGGVGTLLFTITGILVMFLAIILIIRRGNYEIEE